jgi:hypothetical protein
MALPLEAESEGVGHGRMGLVCWKRGDLAFRVGLTGPLRDVVRRRDEVERGDLGLKRGHVVEKRWRSFSPWREATEDVEKVPRRRPRGVTEE